MIKIPPMKQVLYHGTHIPFKKINLKREKEYKDFGKGFYLSTRKGHSISIAKRNMKIFHGTKAILYSYNTVKTEYERLYKAGKIKYFYEADIEWLDFVLKSRDNKETWHEYDVVIGPIADDDTKYLMNNYREGVYGAVGSIEAKNILLKYLKVDKHPTQIFIATEEGLKILDEESRGEEDVTNVN